MAAFSAFEAVFVFARVPVLSLLPVIAVALMRALAAIRRDPLLRLAAACAAALYVLAGVSPVRAS